LHNIETLKQQLKRARRRADEKNHLHRRMKYISMCYGGNKEETLKAFPYWYIYKSTASPCSCWVCQGERYSRKMKHKKVFE
jgi:hypothetical protein